MIGRGWIVPAAGMLMFASALLARPGIVVTGNGQRFEGDIKENPGGVTVTIKGIATTIDRSNIASLVYAADAARVYQEQLAQLAPADIEGRIKLAQWAVGQNRPDLALDALEQVMKIDPNNRQAFDFMRIIKLQRRLNSEERPGAAKPTATSPAATSAPTTQSALSPSRYVSPADINIIRQLELKSTDTGVRVRIDNGIRRQYVARAGTTFRAFDDMTPAQQAVAIIGDGDMQWRRGVSIQNDPPSLMQFKRQIQPVILPGCATSGCHGNADRGGFELYTPAAGDAVSYTNFYILTQYARTLSEPGTERGAFAGAARLPMLNRTRPEESLLAQYGLPRGMATYSHPDVPGFRPIYRNRHAIHYQELIQWLGQSLVNVQPDYGLDDVRLPATRPATRPATKPTTKPATRRGHP